RPSADTGKTTPSGASPSIRLPVITARPQRVGERGQPRRLTRLLPAYAESPRGVNGPFTAPRFLPRCTGVRIDEGRNVRPGTETIMRRLIAGAFVTLDGVAQDPGGFGEIENGGWALDYFDETSTKQATDALLASDIFLLGRATYEVIEKVWSRSTGPYAE